MWVGETGVNICDSPVSRVVRRDRSGASGLASCVLSIPGSKRRCQLPIRTRSVEDGVRDGLRVAHAHSRSWLRAPSPLRAPSACGPGRALWPITTLSGQAFFIGSGIWELAVAFFFFISFQSVYLADFKKRGSSVLPKSCPLNTFNSLFSFPGNFTSCSLQRRLSPSHFLPNPHPALPCSTAKLALRGLLF
ncbi:hypothetical protein HJG60_009378 [Phyllostomus discolor]|uniref:Uncharacterized protein n=1 Tax=Phyllostomus discolor TaxID=89673 RepID=A0A833YIP8_9CHIR|nr:hypothetical protein HJG60_009378 [Phyllostomus discolor]